MTPQSEHAPSRVDEVCSPSGRAVFQAAGRAIFFGMVGLDEGGDKLISLRGSDIIQNRG